MLSDSPVIRASRNSSLVARPVHAAADLPKARHAAACNSVRLRVAISVLVIGFPGATEGQHLPFRPRFQKQSGANGECAGGGIFKRESCRVMRVRLPKSCQAGRPLRGRVATGATPYPPRAGLPTLGFNDRQKLYVKLPVRFFIGKTPCHSESLRSSSPYRPFE